MTYCYSDLEGGPVWELNRPMGEAPKSIVVAGVTLHRDLRSEHAKHRSGDPWTEHWSDAMGARTPQHAKEIAARCRAAGLDCQFKYGTHGPLKVNGRLNQKRLGSVVNADRGRMVNFDDC